jgi:putative glutamate/gamma-aminobutyrate antiporter
MDVPRSKKVPVPSLGIFSLAMINVAAIASLRDLPQMAKYGAGSIFFYLLAGLVFFIPVSLVAAELATGWPEKGGVYVWVKEAFGAYHGFAAVFIQWFQNLCWYPVVLTFAAASLAFAVDPSAGATQLAENKAYIVTVILCTYWGATFWNFRGLRASARLSMIGAFSGVVIPGVELVVLACAYVLTWAPSHLSLAASDFFPDMAKPGNITFASSVLLAFAGMEMTSVHIRETRNPGRTYPVAIAVAAGTIILAFILGALSIAVALAPSEYTLQTGVTKALDTMLNGFGIPYLGHLFAFMMAFGVIGSVNSWIIGPSKGILAAAEDGMLPKWFCKTNRHGVPKRVLMIQAVIVSLLCLTFTLQPTVASAYFMLSDLTIQLYLIMYMGLFAAALRLRYTQPKVFRAFRVPLGNPGMWFVAGLGILGAIGCVFIGFFPPTQLAKQHIQPVIFVSFLSMGIVTVIALPYLIQVLLRKMGRG